MRYLIVLLFLLTSCGEDVRTEKVYSETDREGDSDSDEEAIAKPAAPEAVIVEKPEVKPEIKPTPIEIGNEDSTARIVEFDWKNDQWSEHLIKEVINHDLMLQTPSDIKSYCPNYANLHEMSKTMFWANLMVAMAKKESNYNPNTSYTENFSDSQGRLVVSRGLFQLSLESANQRAYGCGFKNAGEIYDPLKNITCSVNILSHWVKKDNRIGEKVSGSWLGGARYWSVLRSGASADYVKKTAQAACKDITP